MGRISPQHSLSTVPGDPAEAAAAPSRAAGPGALQGWGSARSRVPAPHHTALCILRCPARDAAPTLTPRSLPPLCRWGSSSWCSRTRWVPSGTGCGDPGPPAWDSSLAPPQGPRRSLIWSGAGARAPSGPPAPPIIPRERSPPRGPGAAAGSRQPGWFPSGPGWIPAPPRGPPGIPAPTDGPPRLPPIPALHPRAPGIPGLPWGPTVPMPGVGWDQSSAEKAGCGDTPVLPEPRGWSAAHPDPC